MKNNLLIKFFPICLFVVLAFTACTDLEVEATDSTILEVTASGFAKVDPTATLASLYDDLDALINQTDAFALNSHTSDEMIPPTRGVDWGDNGVWRVLHAHTWDGTNTWIVNTWNQMNSRVLKATKILFSDPTPQQAAEAKFLRAYYMHYVMDYFGQVPFRDVMDSPETLPMVMTRAEAYDFVVKDLTEAVPDLPTIAPTANNTAASKAAANALLSRIYLNAAVYKASNPAGPYTHDNADLDLAIAAADAVMNDGYSLDNNYFNNFDPTGESEIIWTTARGNQDFAMRMTLHYSQNPDGWNGFTTLADFYDMFEAGDQRIGAPATPDGTDFSGLARGFLIGQQFNDDGSQTIDSRNQMPLQFTRDVPLAGAATDKGIRVLKYHPQTKPGTNYRLLRYGEVYLNKAEAIMRKGGDALTMVNDLRDIRGASRLMSLDEATMLAERGRETYWEGRRRTDQVRFGTFNSTWSEKTVTEDFRVLFPIPSVALSSNSNLSQNAGY